MARSFRRKASKAQRARGAITTVAAFRLFGLRRVLAVAGAGALVATALIAKRRSSTSPAPVPGAPPTEASAPTPPQNGTSLQDAAEQARAAAASLAPQGGGAA